MWGGAHRPGHKCYALRSRNISSLQSKNLLQSTTGQLLKVLDNVFWSSSHKRRHFQMAWRDLVQFELGQRVNEKFDFEAHKQVYWDESPQHNQALFTMVR